MNKKNKIINWIINDFNRNFKFYIVLILVLLLFVIKLDYYVYSPGGLIDLTDRINVENSYKQKGSFNMTYVTARKGTIMNIMLSYIIPNWELESIDNMRFENEGEDEIETRDKILLEESNYSSVIAAFEEANIPYKIDSIDLKISYVYTISKSNLKPNDIIKGIDDYEISDFKSLDETLNKYKVNDKISIKVIRNKKEVTCNSTLIDINDKPSIGIILSEMKNIITDPKIEFIYKNNESGSSRGLLASLDIYNKITEFDLTKGRIISGTGTINEDGSVGSIGGVKYKIIGASKKGADIFLVPTKNYEEAIKVKNENNLDIEVIEADTLHNVIEKLK